MATLTTSQFYSVGRCPTINAIQEDDPSYDPLGEALIKSGVLLSLFNNACDRVYYDGYYGPISDEEWLEQDGRVPSSVRESIWLIAKVLSEIEDYKEIAYCDDLRHSPYARLNDEYCEDECIGHEVGRASAEEIRREIVYWYREIYGVDYPHV